MPRRGHALPIACVIAVFALSRGAAWLAGVRFDATTLTTFWQILDPTLLRTRLLESVWYLHSQPPLYNLLLGIGLKLFGSHFALAAHVVQCGLGLTMAVSLYALLVLAGLPRWWAAAAASLFSGSPAAILFENWLFYGYPVATLLLVSALAFAWLERRPTPLRSLAVFGTLATVCLTRSSFQIVVLLLVLALMLALFHGSRRAIAAGALVPLLLVGSVYVKNWVVVGEATTSSWTGMNLMQVAVHGMSTQERLELVQRGVLSPLSRVDVFQPLAAYRGVVSQPRPRGVRALDEREKAPGVPNFNNFEYVRIASGYLHDFLRVLAHRPGAYLRGVYEGVRLALTPATNTDFVAPNRSRIRAWERVFDAVVLWRTPYARGTAWLILLTYAAALAFGLVETVRALRGRGSRLLAYVWLVLVYSTGVMTLGEVVENQRIRFDGDALAVVLAAALAARAVAWVRERRRAPLASADLG